MSAPCTFWPQCDRRVTVTLDGRERYCTRHAIWVAELATRQAVLVRDGGRCRKCGAEGNSLDWAHIRSRGAHPTLRYEMDNSLMLCRKDHAAFHADPAAWVRFIGDEFGLDHYTQLGLRSIVRDRTGTGTDLAEVIRSSRAALLTPAEAQRYERGTW